MTSEKSQLIGGQSWFTFDRSHGWVTAPSPGGELRGKHDDVLIPSIPGIIAGKASNIAIIHSTDNLLRLHGLVSATLSSVARETSTRLIFANNYFSQLTRWKMSIRAGGGGGPGPGQQEGGGGVADHRAQVQVRVGRRAKCALPVSALAQACS